MIQEEIPERPRVDVRRSRDGLQIEMDAAGVQDVIVRAEGHTLVIDGQRPALPKETYLIHERVRTPAPRARTAPADRHALPRCIVDRRRC